MRTRCLAVVASLAALACPEPTPPAQAPIHLVQRVLHATIGNETRIAMLLRPPWRSRRVDVQLPAEPILTLGMGIPNADAGLESGPLLIEVALETAARERHVLVQRRVDPSGERRWLDAELELSRWSGERVSIEFRIEPQTGNAPVPSVAFGDPVVYSRGVREERPNVLMISIDTLRARSVHAYGYPRETTPFLDELALRGTLFENAITSATSTAPAHMSLFTGLYPIHHGLRTGLQRLYGEAPALAEELRSAGYRTAAFTENGFLIRDRGFDRGFGEYTENRGGEPSSPGEVRVTFPQAQRWLTRNARRPFFLFVHTYQVHGPFQAPASYAMLFADDGHPGPADALMLRLRDHYDREIRFVDDELRALLASVDALGLRDSTLVVVLSDHGEEFHEHGHYQHGAAVYEETLRIPLIITGPGIRAGGRVKGQVSLIDLLPTLLDLVGAPVPPALDGTSLAGALRTGQEPPPRLLFAEANSGGRWLHPFERQPFNPPLIAVRSQHTKFIVHRPQEGKAQPTEHYDLRRDPLERQPLADSGEGLAAAAEAAVDDYLRAGAAASAAGTSAELDPGLRERLRELGYVE